MGYRRAVQVSIDLMTRIMVHYEQLRRGDRVAEGGALLRRCAGNRTEGSNPSLSAIYYESKDNARLLAGR
jgi:hypothetical protein